MYWEVRANDGAVYACGISREDPSGFRVRVILRHAGVESIVISHRANDVRTAVTMAEHARRLVLAGASCDTARRHEAMADRRLQERNA